MCNCVKVGRIGAPKRRSGGSRGSAKPRFLGDQAGAMAVEFAFVLPFFLMVIFATVELGRALSARNEMNHALGRAVRVVNLDSGKTADEIAAFLRADLAKYDPEDLTVSASQKTVSGNDFVKISVSFPFRVIIPFSAIPTVTLNVETLAPELSPLK